MKIAASDYDGTLFRNDEIAAEDARGVHAWRAAGHKFGVVTGRDYGMLVPQLHHYGVEFDYAVCNNGGIIHDAAGHVLHQEKIAARVLHAIVAEPGVRRSLHFAFSAPGRTFLCHDREGSWIMREAEQWDFPVVKITEEEIVKLPDIHQFSLGYDDPQEAAEVASILKAKYGADVHAYPNRGSVDITPPDGSKRNGIEKLKQVMGWQGAVVYAIGDEVNDLPMIEAYRGFTVDTARDVIKAKARASYASVGAMLEANL